MNTPTGLSEDALALWESTTNKYQLEMHELLLLKSACVELTLVERIQKEVDDLKDLMDEGSMGQRVVSDLVKEVRQHRAKFEATIKALGLPTESDPPTGNRSTQARDAAKARWRRAG